MVHQRAFSEVFVSIAFAHGSSCALQLSFISNIVHSAGEIRGQLFKVA